MVQIFFQVVTAVGQNRTISQSLERKQKSETQFVEREIQNLFHVTFQPFLLIGEEKEKRSPQTIWTAGERLTVQPVVEAFFL